MATFNMLLCTVGGSPEPLLKSLLEWKPARALFIPSTQTISHVDSILRAYAEHAGAPLNPGQYEVYPVSDAEGLTECLDVMRTLDREVVNWHARGAHHQVIADFTAGTKCMTAALALQARRWPCRYSYVGGARRSKEGVGVVETGSERVVHWSNPWNALGYQAIEDACLLFDQHAFTSAGKLLDKVRKEADDVSVKRTLSTFHQLCEGYGLWDRFQHKDALERVDNVLKNANDLQAALGPSRYSPTSRTIGQHREALQQLVGQQLSRPIVADLLANADRRRHEGRYDDAVARLYRAIEGLAQLALGERHRISDTGKVALDRIPEPLREEWRKRADKSAKLRLGLQDDYKLLAVLGDEIGKTFKTLELDISDEEDEQSAWRSPLTARNNSILAHGFKPVTENVVGKLREAAMTLGGFTAEDLPVFPRLAA